jgi:hypothetical protein
LKAEYTESNEQLIIVESENLKYQEDIKGKIILVPFKGLTLTFNQKILNCILFICIIEKYVLLLLQF